MLDNDTKNAARPKASGAKSLARMGAASIAKARAEKLPPARAATPAEKLVEDFFICCGLASFVESDVCIGESVSSFCSRAIGYAMFPRLYNFAISLSDKARVKARKSSIAKFSAQ